MSSPDSPPVLAPFPMAFAADVALVTRVVAAEPDAVAQFERLLERCRGAIATIERAPHFGDEVLQQLRADLLTDEPRLLQYAGTGPLLAWLRASAVRLALRMRAKAGPTAPAAAEQNDALDEAIAEIGLLRSEARTELGHALRTALRSLGPRERAVLRLVFVDGQSQTAVAARYGVHEASVSRWLAASREKLHRATRAALSEQLGPERPAVDSLLGLVDHDVSMSLERLLATADD